MEGAIELESLKPQIDANQVLHRPGKEREEHNHDWDVQVRESREDEVSGRVSAQDLDNPHLPPVDQGRQAWVFCICACIFETFVWGWNNTYGVFQDYYTSHPPFNTSSAAAVSVIGTASLGIQYIEIVLVMTVCQRYPEYAKRAMWVSLSIATLSLFLSSFATKLWHLLLLQGVIFGLSAGVLYAPVMIWLSEWFVVRRGLAGGIIFGGAGVGGFVLPLTMGYLLEALGFRWTLRIWALILGICCGIALLGVNPRIPVHRPTMDIPRQAWFPKDIHHLKTPLMFLLIGITVFQALGLFPVSLFIPTYTSSLSSATLPSTIVLALFNATSVIFYIVFGHYCDKYPYPYVILVSGTGSALAAFILWGFASSLGWVFAFAVIFGGLNGGFSAIWPAAASEIGGTRNHIISLAMGCFAAVKGIAAVVGPLIAAALHDTSNRAKSLYGGFGFRNVEIFVGSMAVATSLGGVCLLFYSTSKRKLQ